MINDTVYNAAKDVTPTAWIKFKAKANELALRAGAELDQNKAGTITAVMAVGTFLLVGDILEEEQTQTIIAAYDAGLI